nr:MULTISPECIES: hypothetical protein [Halobacillus]
MDNQKLQNGTGRVVGRTFNSSEYRRFDAYINTILFLDAMRAEALSIFTVQHKRNGRISS